MKVVLVILNDISKSFQLLRSWTKLNKKTVYQTVETCITLKFF